MSNFSLDAAIDHYCVMGNPVAHSKSPQIHKAFAEQTKQHLDYQVILVEEGGFPAALDEFQRQGGMGLNITVPFKGDAWEVCHDRTQRAERAQAVNTIWFGDDGVRHGDNTDGIGLIRDLTVNHQIKITGQDVLILGAGGAVQGILELLLDQQPTRIVIANRTLSRAEQLVQIFSDYDHLKACGYDELEGKQFNIVINGTSASLQGEVPPLPDKILTENACCYDLMYSNVDTAFVRWAKSHNSLLALDGLGMLVEQAAESFYLWRGVLPETKAVIELLREQ
ncbi:MAG: shikimate dehydrogenase [Gammaproteobacteria bacterium]